jgi:hypothetical protein
MKNYSCSKETPRRCTRSRQLNRCQLTTVLPRHLYKDVIGSLTGLTTAWIISLPQPISCGRLSRNFTQQHILLAPLLVPEDRGRSNPASGLALRAQCDSGRRPTACSTRPSKSRNLLFFQHCQALSPSGLALMIRTIPQITASSGDQLRTNYTAFTPDLPLVGGGTTASIPAR